MQQRAHHTDLATTPARRRLGVIRGLGLVAAALAWCGSATANAAPADPSPTDPTPANPAPSDPETAETRLLSDVANPSVSASAGSVVFTATTPDGRRSIFHLDRSDGDLTDLVTVPDARRIGDTVAATLSGDGCVVFAISQIGFDIFRDDDNNQRWDVYRLVLPHCDGRPNDWQLISDTARGTARDDIDPDQRLSVSADGTIVAFTVNDAGPIEGPVGDGLTSVVTVNVTEPIGAPQRTFVVPGRPDERPTRPFHYRGADQPALSADGSRIAFRADFDPSRETWNEGAIEGEQAATRVWVWDPNDDGGESTSDPNDGTDRTWRSPTAGDDPVDQSEPVLSADGSTLAFTAPVGDDASCSATCPTQVYRWALDADTVPELVSAQPWSDPSAASAEAGQPSAPFPGDGDSRAPALNANGTVVAFITDADNLTLARPDRGGRPDDGMAMIWGTIADLDGSRSYLVPARRPVPGDGAPGEDDAGEDDPGEDDPGDGGSDNGGSGEDGAAELTPLTGTDDHPAVSATGSVVVFDTAASVDPSVFDAPTAQTLAQISTAGRQLGFATNATSADIAQLDFGAVQVGQQSAELYTSLRNLGPSSIRPSAVYTDSAGFEVQGGTCQAEVVIAPGQSCTIRVTFTPTGGGDSSATLVVDDATGTVARTELSGQGGDPRLRIDPAGADLGQGSVGQVDRGTATVTITNIALDATQVGEVIVGGHHSEDFPVVSDQCTGAVLAPEQNCTVELSFSPTGSGYRSATVVARATTGDRAAAVVGGHANRIPVLDPVTASAEPGTPVQITGGGFDPGTFVWAGIIGERGLSGPFAVGDDGTVAATVDLPSHRLDEVIDVAIQGDSTAVLAAPITVDQRPVTTPSYLPGFGYG